MIKTTQNGLSRQDNMTIDVCLLYYKEKEQCLLIDLVACVYNIHMYENERLARIKIIEDLATNEFY